MCSGYKLFGQLRCFDICCYGVFCLNSPLFLPLLSFHPILLFFLPHAHSSILVLPFRPALSLLMPLHAVIHVHSGRRKKRWCLLLSNSRALAPEAVMYTLHLLSFIIHSRNYTAFVCTQPNDLWRNGHSSHDTKWRAEEEVNSLLSLEMRYICMPRHTHLRQTCLYTEQCRVYRTRVLASFLEESGR